MVLSHTREVGDEIAQTQEKLLQLAFLLSEVKPSQMSLSAVAEKIGSMGLKSAPIHTQELAMRIREKYATTPGIEDASAEVRAIILG